MEKSAEGQNRIVVRRRMRPREKSYSKPGLIQRAYGNGCVRETSYLLKPF